MNRQILSNIFLSLFLIATYFICEAEFSLVFAQTSQQLSSPPKISIAENPNLNPLRVLSVEITPTQQDKEIQPGKTVEVKVKVHIDHGFHAYLEQYKLELVDPKSFYLSEIQVRPTQKFVDPVTKKIKFGTQDYAEIVSLLDIPKNTLYGSQKLILNLTYQACGEGFCLFPKTLPIETKIKVHSTLNENDPLTRALANGWWYAIFIVFLAGIITSFTPCIFPMIPITLAVIGTHSQSSHTHTTKTGHTTGHVRSKMQGFIISLAYVFGIAFTYSMLGIVAAKTGALFGSLLGHPLVVSAVSLLFVFMGLSMYGLFEIQVPHFISKRLSGTKTQKGIFGAFASGLIAGIVASPCVGPVLISILAFVAQSQNTFTGLVLLFTYALGLGQIFIVFGTFQSLLHKLPRSGPWLNQVKFLFGTLMIAMAFYYVYPIAMGPIFDGFVATALICASVYITLHLRKSERKTHESGHIKSDAKKLKAFSVVLFTAGLIFATKSIVPQHISAQFFQLNIAKETVLKPQWYVYTDELLKKALDEHKPIIIDFHAEWCLACKELSLYTFSDPRIIKLGEQFIWLEFDATSPSPFLDELQSRYQFAGLPFVVLYSRDGELLKNLNLSGFEDADHFLERMKSALK
ncbi:MAG: cytochrome c biogenesis protein CcdA [Bdellovibrionales bacterium]